MIAIIALLLAVCLPQEPSLAKKPPKPPPEPPTPPVQYSIQFFDTPGSGALFVSDMNIGGCVVGRYVISGTSGYHGYVYNHPRLEDPGVHDLNDIVSGLPDDWRIQNAMGVNDLGDIVGYIVPDDENPDDLARAPSVPT